MDTDANVSVNGASDLPNLADVSRVEPRPKRGTDKSQFGW